MTKRLPPKPAAPVKPTPKLWADAVASVIARLLDHPVTLPAVNWLSRDLPS
jgi:hypothetical protein